MDYLVAFEVVVMAKVRLMVIEAEVGDPMIEFLGLLPAHSSPNELPSLLSSLNIKSNHETCLNTTYHIRRVFGHLRML